LIIAKNNFFISNYSIQAKHGKNNFAVALHKGLYNKRVVGAALHEFDRVVEIKMLEHSIILELLGEGNQILIEKGGKIISCAKNEEWADRTTKKGEKYIFPKHSLNPAKVLGGELHNIFSASQKDAIRTLLIAVNMPPVLAEEVLLLIKIDKSRAANSITAAEAEKISKKINGFYSNISILQEGYLPVAYKTFIFPFRLAHLKEEPVNIKSINDYLNENLVHSIATPKEHEKSQVSKGKVSGLEFMKAQQIGARSKFESQIEQNKQKAELIYKHYSEIDELRKAVLSGIEKGKSEKQILEALAGASKNGSAAAGLLRKLSLKDKKMELELD